MGRHTKHGKTDSSTSIFIILGGYELLEERMREFVIPDLSQCKVRFKTRQLLSCNISSRPTSVMKLNQLKPFEMLLNIFLLLNLFIKKNKKIQIIISLLLAFCLYPSTYNHRVCQPPLLDPFNSLNSSKPRLRRYLKAPNLLEPSLSFC